MERHRTFSGVRERASLARLVMYDLWLPVSRTTHTYKEACDLWGLKMLAWAVCSSTVLSASTYSEAVVGVTLVAAESRLGPVPRN